MSFFEFPHTRTYDSDLGWLINNAQEMTEQINSILSSVSAIESDMTTIKKTLATVNAGRAAHHVMIISDSYLLHNDAADRLAALDPFDSYELHALSGYGFMGNGGSYRFVDFIDTLTADDSITDVIFVGGYNDGSYIRNGGSESTMRQAIADAVIAVHDKFPAAAVSIGMFGWTRELTDAGAAQRRILASSILRFYMYPYANITSDAGCKCSFISASPAILKNPAWIDSTSYHPNRSGTDAILTAIISHIYGESRTTLYHEEQNAELDDAFSGANLVINAEHMDPMSYLQILTSDTLTCSAGTLTPDSFITIGTVPEYIGCLLPSRLSYVLPVAQIGLVVAGSVVKTTASIRITNRGLIQLYTRESDVNWSAATGLAIFSCTVSYI